MVLLPGAVSSRLFSFDIACIPWGRSVAMRRFLFILMMAAARLATGLARLGAEESGDRPLNCRCPPWAESSFGPTSSSFTNGAFSGTSLPATTACWTRSDVRHAWGTLQDCQSALDEIKRHPAAAAHAGQGGDPVARAVPQPRRDGHAGESTSEKGGYEVFNVTYPSTQSGVAEHAQALCANRGQPRRDRRDQLRRP